MQTPIAERIVIYCGESGADARLSEALSERFPDLEIRQTDCLESCLNLLEERSCAVTILDYDIAQARDAELLTRLRLLDEEPEVLIISRCDNPEVIRRIAVSHRRYVVKDSQLIGALAQAIRDTLRIRRLEREAASLRSNLVRANAELQERNDRLDEFCTMLAHDIRVPLSALSLKIEHLQEQQGDSLDSRGRVALASSVESARHVLRLVEATYDMSRLRVAKVSMSPLNLKELVERVAVEVKLTAHRPLEVSCESMPLIYGNSALLERVFLNVIGNSVKYSDQDTVRVQFRVLSREGEYDSRYSWIECRDNGPGIRREDQESVFLMFRRGSDQRDKEGLGVGLSVVKSVVELHGGEARLGDVMEGDRGCRLLISLPHVA